MANATTSQILFESSGEVLYKITNISDGTAESTTVKVDVSKLNGAIFIITHGNSQSAKSFSIGETVTQAVTGAAGRVYRVPDTTHVWIYNTSGIDFDGTNVITGGTSTKAETPSDSTNASAVNILDAWWTINSAKTVSVVWEATTPITSLTLIGTGKTDFKKGDIPNNALGTAGVTGNIAVTWAPVSGDSYTIILRLRKNLNFGWLTN